MPSYSKEIKARALVDAALSTDAEAADRHGCSERSIRNWRSGLDESHELQRLVTERWREVRSASSWVQDATRTIRKAQGFIRKGASELDASDPEAIRAMTEALQVMTDALQMARIVDARLGKDRQDGGAHRQDAADRLRP